MRSGQAAVPLAILVAFGIASGSYLKDRQYHYQSLVLLSASLFLQYPPQLLFKNRFLFNIRNVSRIWYHDQMIRR